jgi:perosamine synthetase
MTIPLLKPSCTEEEIVAVTEVLRSGWWGMGPKCDEFEKRLADRYGMKHCITVNSCTAALHLSVLAHGIGPGDEVIVPALTFISTALAATYCGAKVVFADIDPETLCIDWKDVVSKITDRTKAIIPVDYAGYPAYPPTRLIPAASLIPGSITVIQDAAHSSGGLPYGSEVCLSFHAVKNLATGDGGAVLTNDDAVDEFIRAARWCGINRSTWERSKAHYGWDYQIDTMGYKAHWNDIQASIGLVQLSRLDAINARRREIAERYTRGLQGLPLTLPTDHLAHTWHLYPVRVKDGMDSNGLIDWLLMNSISAGVHYKPLTEYPMYDYQFTPPVTDVEWRKLVSLPIFYDLTNAEQDNIIHYIRRFFGE